MEKYYNTDPQWTKKSGCWKIPSYHLTWLPVKTPTVCRIGIRPDSYYPLHHGRARVAHCVTGRWRNVSHYCRPLHLIYVFWAQRSTARCSVSTRCAQTRVYSARGKNIVRHLTSREVSLRHRNGWGTWNVSPQYRDLCTRALYCLQMEMDREHLQQCPSLKFVHESDRYW